jgi:hypothetical protein
MENREEWNKIIKETLLKISVLKTKTGEWCKHYDWFLQMKSIESNLDLYLKANENGNDKN